MGVGALTTFIMILGSFGSSIPTYRWTDHGSGEQLTCQQCVPGTFVARHCSAQTETECQPCPDLHYTQYWNYLARCRYCNVFCGDQEQVKLECNSTHNRVCECQPGYHRGSQFCVRHTKCRPGFGVSQKGTPDSDTQCVQCPPGTFSPRSSALQPCLPHRNCSELGLQVNVPGTPYHNALCTHCLGTFNAQELDAECDQAVLEFVTHQTFSTNHLWRLEESLLRLGHIHRQPKGHRKLYSLLSSVRAANPGQPILPLLLQVLKKAKLSRLERKIRHRFLGRGAVKAS